MVAVLEPQPVTPRVGPTTWDEFVALPEDDRRELLDGYLLEVEVPTFDHEAIVALVIFHLYGWARANGARVIGSGYKIKVSPRRGLMPDVQLYRAGRRPPLQALVEGAPDLAVEVISPSSGKHDRVTKLNYYRSIGVPEYWLIDPFDRTFARFVLVDGNYVIEIFDSEDTVRPNTFAGLEIALPELWATMAAASDDASDPTETTETTAADGES